MKKVQNWISVIGIMIFAGVFLYGWRLGIFTDQDKMAALLSGAGVLAPILFVVIQIVQVVIPIIPGGVSCLFGVLFFGKIFGFVYNYVGLCIGSVIVFWLARTYGVKIVRQMIGEKAYDKYHPYLTREKHFHTFFATCIFLPCAPDDALCYIAGLSDMKLRQFIAIIILCKPWAILAYSFGLNLLFEHIIHLIGG